MGSKFNGELLMTQGLAVVSDGINSGLHADNPRQQCSSNNPSRAPNGHPMCSTQAAPSTHNFQSHAFVRCRGHGDYPPRRAPLTLKQKQQFKATVSGTT